MTPPEPSARPAARCSADTPTAGTPPLPGGGHPDTHPRDRHPAELVYDAARLLELCGRGWTYSGDDALITELRRLATTLERQGEPTA